MYKGEKDAEFQARSIGGDPSLLRSAVEAAANAIVICTGSGHIEWVNAAFSRMTGYSREEALGAHTRILKSGRHDAAFYRNLWETILSGRVFQAEMINCRKDGSLYTERNTITPVRGPDGAVQRFIAVKEDVSDRVKAEEQCRNSDERFRLLFEYAPDAFYIHDLNGVFIDGNRGAENLIGYRREELIGRSFVHLELLDEHDLAKAVECLERNRAGEDVFVELVLNRKDGKRVPVEIKAYPVEIEGRVLVLGIARDVSARRLADVRLQIMSDMNVQLQGATTLSRLAEVVSSAADRLFGWDGCFIDLIDTSARRRRRLLQQSTVNGRKTRVPFESELTPFEGPLKRLLRHACAGIVVDHELIASELPEVSRTGSFMIAPMRHEGNTVGLICLQRHGINSHNAHDLDQLQMFADCLSVVMERISAREALVESESNYRALIDRIPDAVFIHVDEKIVFANAATAKLAGATHERDLIGMSGLLFAPREAHDEIRQNLRRCVEGKGNPVKERNLCRLDGSQFRAEVVSVPFTYRGQPAVQTIIRDVTERRRLEEFLHNSQKLQAIGTLAGGIAHDFNNILGGIMGYTQLAALDAGTNAGAKESLREVLKAADRARDLVAQILTFSRQQKQQRQVVTLSTVTKEVLKLLRATLPATIQIDSRIDKDAPSVLADPTQVHQVLMNLCTNAAHAIGARTGRIEVSLTRAEFDAAGPAEHPGTTAGVYAQLSVSDDGCGIPAENLKRIFEPFFTTKHPWEGTGLGLAVVHGIVEEHGGVIEVRSEPGVGTCFDIYFPECRGNVDSVNFAGEELPCGSGEHILFVDDESALADTARRLLEQLGYKVTAETDPRNALKRVCDAPQDFDLLFTDLTMPGLTGADLVVRVLEQRPGMPVLVATGFNATWNREALQQLGVHDLVMKPLSPAVLAQSVRNALKGRNRR